MKMKLSKAIAITLLIFASGVVGALYNWPLGVALLLGVIFASQA